MVTAFEEAGLPVAQVAFEVNTQVTMLPLTSVVLLYDAEVPTKDPSRYHAYAGAAPPFTGEAEKATLVPEHIAPAGTAAMLTLTGKFGFTVMVMAFEVAGLPVAQRAFEVSTHVTISLVAKVVLVYVVPVPTLVPFNFQS